MNNNLFNRNLILINLHEKKRLNLTDRKSLDLRAHFSGHYQDPGFITQRTMYEEENLPMDIGKIRREGLGLWKFNFKYCFLKVKGEESPLKIGSLFFF